MKKRKGADQLLAVALSASMVVSMNAPVAAWAETGEEGSATPGSQVVEVEPVEPVGEQAAEPVTEPSEAVGAAKVKETPAEFAARGVSNTTTVATIGEVGYDTLQGAIDAAEPGATVSLVADVAENVVIPANADFTLDLAGHTLNGGTVAGKATLTNNGTLVVEDSAAGGTVKREDNATAGYYVVDNQGKLTVNGGTFANNSGFTKENGTRSGASLVRNGGVSADRANELIVNGGTFEQLGFIVVKNDDYGKLAVNGGTFRTQDDAVSTNSAIQNWGQATVDGGDIEGALWVDAWSGDLASSEMTVGGDVTFKGKIVVGEYASKHDVSKPAVLKVTGGTFDVESWGVPSTGAQVSLTGGTYAADPSLYVAEGHEVVQSGGRYVVQLSDFAQMTIDGTTTSYNDPMEFVTALVSAAGKTIDITMTENVEVDGYIPVAEGQTVTLNMNGKTLTSSYAGAFIQNKGTLTITGNGTVYTTDVAAQGRHAITNYGTLAIENGTFGSAKSRGNAIRNFGTATIKGGVFTACDNYTNGGYAYAVANGSSSYPNAAMMIENATVSGKMNGVLACDGGTLVVKGGTYTLGDGTTNDNYRLAYVSGNGTVSIEGGTFARNVKNQYGFFGGGDSNEGTTGSVNVSGGEFEDLVNQNILFDTGSINVSGGTFKDGIAAGKKPGKEAKVSVTGGTYAAAIPAGLVADGYLAEPDADKGSYTVKEAAQSENKVQIVDENGNATGVAKSVSDVVADVQQSGGSLVLAGDVTESAGITVPEVSDGTDAKQVTIELNGNNVTASGADAAVTVGAGAQLVISDAKGSGVISSTSALAPAVEVAGTVTLDGATVASSSSDGIKVAAGATLTVESGVVDAKASTPNLEYRSARSAAPGRYGISAFGESGKTTTLNIKGGKISGEAGALNIDENVTCTVTGGVFNSSVSTHINTQNYKQTEANGLYYIAPIAENAYNVAQFKGNAADSSTWTAPIAPAGKAFAGWYTDGTYATPSTATEGTAYAKFVNIADVMKFKGGSLRMDATPSVSEGLRFGYSLFLPEEMQFVSSGWKYTIKGTDYTKVAEHQALYDSGVIDTNLVFLNVPKSDYAEDISVEMYVTYKTSDGTTVTFKEPTAQIRSVNKVAQFILDSPNASAEEKEYAQKILA